MTKLTSNSIIFRIFSNPSGVPSAACGVRSLEQLDKVLDHFEQYPLQTKKHVDFCLFKEVVMKMKRGEHLTTEGLQDIINLKATLNKGLTPLLQEAFPECIPVPRSDPLFKGGWIHPSRVGSLLSRRFYLGRRLFHYKYNEIFCFHPPGC